MEQTLVRLLVILVIHGQTNAFISFSDITTLIKWGDAIFIKGIQYYDAVDSLTSTDSEKLNRSLKQLNEISADLKAFTSSINIKLDKMLDTLLTNLRISISLQPLKTELTNHLNTVRRYYNDAMDYSGDNKSYTDDTLKNFAHLVLSTSENLPATLQKIHQLLTATTREGYLQLLLHDTVDNLPHDCDRNISAQQEMYHTYISVLIAEMNGFSVLNQVYLIKQTFDKDHKNYTNELTLAKDRYIKRLTDYNNRMSQYLSLFPREIRRCDVNPPKRGVNFLELSNVARAKIWDEEQINRPSKLQKAFGISRLCWSTCEKLTGNGHVELFGHQIVTDCQDLGRKVVLCPAEEDSHRRYLYWKNEWATYGREVECPTREREISGDFYDRRIEGCGTCVCSQYSNWRSRGIKRYMNLSPQLSDIGNNMVVTGVKFVMDGESLSLQIQQNKFSSGGMSNETGSWKSVGPSEYSLLIDYERRSLYLDDIIVPDNYAVTGVKFDRAEDPSGYQLTVHATPFDFNTGELHQFNSIWLDAGDYSNLGEDYERSRVEIDMGDADDPTRGSAFNYDPETNKFIKFTHTSLHKDAGQTTIPLIETLPVESMSTFPLSGIGISYKGRDGFGGYIAPRIYTIDLSKYIKTI